MGGYHLGPYPTPPPKTPADPFSRDRRPGEGRFHMIRRGFPQPCHGEGAGAPKEPTDLHLLFNLYLQTLRSHVVPETLDGVICSPSRFLHSGKGRDGGHCRALPQPTLSLSKLCNETSLSLSPPLSPGPAKSGVQGPTRPPLAHGLGGSQGLTRAGSHRAPVWTVGQRCPPGTWVEAHVSCPCQPALGSSLQRGLEW